MFERVVIVGVGLIGGSLGLALRERRLARHVVGVDRSVEYLKQALQRGAIDSAADSLDTGVAGADLIVLATPVPQILYNLQRLSATGLPATTILTDVGSTKGNISHAASESPLAASFVPGHPMAGSERSGIAAARADLFIEATWALTPAEAVLPEAVSRVRQMAMGVGARVIHMSAEEHDRAVAVASHLPHVLAYALASVAGDRASEGERVFELVAGSFRSGTRVAHSDPVLWQEIALSNRAQLIVALREARVELDVVADALERNDGEALVAAFRRGHDAAGRAPI